MFKYLLFVGIVLCSCNSQPIKPGGGDTTRTHSEPPEVLRNLVGGDTVAVDTLSDFLKNALYLRYGRDKAVISYQVINNIFPHADSLFAYRKLRCNMSATRIFTAERTRIFFLGRNVVWEGRLTNTGWPLDSTRPDLNYINLGAEPDTTVPGGYSFYFGYIRVSPSEYYELDTFPPYYVVVHYNPERAMVAQDTYPPQGVIVR